MKVERPFVDSWKHLQSEIEKCMFVVPFSSLTQEDIVVRVLYVFAMEEASDGLGAFLTFIDQHVSRTARILIVIGVHEFTEALSPLRIRKSLTKIYMGFERFVHATAVFPVPKKHSIFHVCWNPGPVDPVAAVDDFASICAGSNRHTWCIEPFPVKAGVSFGFCVIVVMRP